MLAKEYEVDIFSHRHVCRCYRQIEGKKEYDQKMQKIFARSGVRTHADICPLDLKSNALTTRPS